MTNILYTSWGYDMTLVNYARVVGETPKCVKVVMIGSRVENDNGMGSGKSYPVEGATCSDIFLLRKKIDKNGNISYKGSYPFSGTSKRMGHFWPYEGNGNYYNSWD